MRAIIKTVKYFSDKRFSTIAGTLVYFLLMSIAPFILWLTLVLGNIDVEKFMSHELFKSVSPFLHSLKDSAESAAGGAGIVLLITSLWSSTNFFYHLRRSGEVIYGSKRISGGIKLRISSLIFILMSVVLVAVFTSLTVAGSRFLDDFVPTFISEIIFCIFLTFAAFSVALVLNKFACPYKISAPDILPGTLLTTALWLVFLIGFNVYMQFATPEKLYGKLASLIIFLLWSYVMMNCFVIGMILNGSFKIKKEYKQLL